MQIDLDNLEFLRRLDVGKMLQSLAHFPLSCRNTIEQYQNVSVRDLIEKKFDKIVIVGMGGSAIGGDIISDWLFETSKIPILVSRGYHLPGYINENTLSFFVSYSGNTEETITAFREAIVRECSIISITSGGLLKELSIEEGVPIFSLPKGLQPRAALPNQFFTIAAILNALNLIGETWEEIDELFPVLKKIKSLNSPDVPLSNNMAKQLATDIKGYFPIVFGGKLFSGVTYRLSTQFNENSKHPAANGVFPEVFHNAIMLREENDDILSNICVLIIHDPLEPDYLSIKIERFKSLLHDRVGKLLEFRAEGIGKVSRILSAVYIGDYITTYLGFLKGLDPSSVESIQKLKMNIK